MAVSHQIILMRFKENHKMNTGERTGEECHSYIISSNGLSKATQVFLIGKMKCNSITSKTTVLCFPDNELPLCMKFILRFTHTTPI